MPQLTDRDVSRFWSKVDQRGPDDCWPWTVSGFRGHTNAAGEQYGCFALNSKCLLIASRVAFFLATGKDPAASIVCHACDNPPCCNPAHLSLGTYDDNGRHRRERGRSNPRYTKIIRPEHKAHRTNGDLLAAGESHVPHVTYRPLPLLNEKGVRNFMKNVGSRGPDECWPWKGHVQNSGYGAFRVAYRPFQAHRIAFLLHYGIDPGLSLVCHSCDNRKCCNPAHLSLGTALDNQRQKWARNPQDCAGERSNRAILTWAKVADIRKQYASGQYTQRELGEQHGVSRSCIRSVIRYENWHLHSN